MARSIYLGIDFGTTNCKAAYVRDAPRTDRDQTLPVEDVEFEVSRETLARCAVYPTLLGAKPGRSSKSALLFGWDFLKRFVEKATRRETVAPLRHGIDMIRSVKSDLGSGRIYHRAKHADIRTPVSGAASVLGNVFAQVQDELPGRVVKEFQLTLSVPASLSTAAREDTRKAAIEVGFAPDKIDFIDEPVAAMIDLLNSGAAADIITADEDRYIAIYDLGGGTLDVCLIKARFDLRRENGLRIENVAISPYARLGGDCLDAAIMDDVVWPQVEDSLGVGKDALPAGLRRAIQDSLTLFVARRLKESLCRNVSDTLRKAKAGPNDDAAWKRASKAKGEAGLDGAKFRIEGFGDLPLRYQMSFDQFDEIMQSYIDSDDPSDTDELLAPLFQVLSIGRITPDQLHAVVLHGGGCRNPWVERGLRKAFKNQVSLFAGTEITRTPDLDRSVARGAAIAGYWRGVRKSEYIRPIASEKLGVMTLGGRTHTLIKASDPLPFPSEHGIQSYPDFKIPRDGLRNILIPWIAGEDERVVGSVVVDLPEGTPAGTQFILKLNVDRNKQLTWYHQLGETGALRPAGHMPDPWTRQPPTAIERELQSHRAAIAKVFQDTGAVPHWMEVREASLLWNSERLEEFELLLHDLDGLPGEARSLAELENLRGLLFSSKGETETAIEHYRAACKLNPQNTVFLANTGWELASVGRDSEAESLLRQALAINPSLDYAYERLADIYRKRGDEPAARRELEQAIRVTESHLASYPAATRKWRQLAHLRRALGLYTEAVAADAEAAKLARDERIGGDHTSLLAGPDGLPHGFKH